MNKVLGFSLAGVLLLLLLIAGLYRMVQWGHDRQNLSDALYYWDHAHCYKITTQRGSVVRFRTEVDRSSCSLEPLLNGPVPPGMEWSSWVECKEYNCKRDQKTDPSKVRGTGGGGFGATREEACRDGENEVRKSSAEEGCQVRNCRCIRTSHKKGTEPREHWSPVPDGGGTWQRNYNP
jgi:hypothetical protein